MEMKIEKNIPIPESRKRYGASITNILRKMKPGDSLVIDSKKQMSWRVIAHRENIQITCRKISDTQSRLWRLE